MTNNDNTISVFVTAHPDDESMFFIPTILSLHNSFLEEKSEIWLICLSNGNYDGLGKIREAELHNVCRILKFHRVYIIHNENLEDSPNVGWPKDVICEVLKRHLSNNNVTSKNLELYTFDEGGVSGHRNHLDTFRGVQRFYHQELREKKPSRIIKAYQLITFTNLIEKYLPIIHWVFLILSFFLVWLTKKGQYYESSSSGIQCYTTYKPWINWKCMAGHTSQFRWYRRLFVLFSCYTYENRWEPISGTNDLSATNEIIYLRGKDE